MDLQLILYNWSSNLVNPFKLKTAGGRRGKCRPMRGGHVTGESRQEVRLVKRQLLPHPRAHSNHEAPTFTGLPPPPVLVHHSPCFRILFLSFTEVGPTTPLPHRQRNAGAPLAPPSPRWIPQRPTGSRRWSEIIPLTAESTLNNYDSTDVKLFESSFQHSPAETRTTRHSWVGYSRNR